MSGAITYRFWTGCLFLFLLSLVPAAATATVSISATVDRTHLTLDDSLELSVRINGTTQGGSPVLPPLPDFQVQPAGTSSSIQIINGTRSASVIHRYLLLPKKEGTFTLGSVQLDLDGKHYEAPPITITVVAPSASLPEKDAPIFAEAEVSNTSPYLQEQIILTYRLYRKVEIRNATLDAPLEHFRKVELGDPVETSRVINGVRYYISEASYALFPMQEGVLSIPPGIFQLDLLKQNSQNRSPFGRFHLPDPFFNDPFFSGGAALERKIIRTQPIEITVRPFPEKGKPEGFTPLTGPLTLESELTPHALSVGETATWTITLKGRANMDEVKLTPPAAGNRFKLYEDQPVTEESPSGEFLEGSKTFKYALVPTRPGTLNVDAIQLHYFDPEKKVYKTLSTGPLNVTIQPGAAPSSSLSTGNSSATSKNTERGASELLPIHTQPGILDKGIRGFQHPEILLPGLLLPPLGFLIFRSYYLKRRRMQLDSAFARRQNARAKALDKLNEIQKTPALDAQKLAREISLVVREYLGDRFDFQGTALTPGEVETRLKRLGLDQQHVKTALALLEHCQEIEYAPVNGIDETGLIEESSRLIRELEGA